MLQTGCVSFPSIESNKMTLRLIWSNQKVSPNVTQSTFTIAPERVQENENMPHRVRWLRLPFLTTSLDLPFA